MPDMNAYRTVAAALGLRMEPETAGPVFPPLVQIDGMLAGRRIHVLRTRGDDLRVKFHAGLHPPLGLGLSVRRSGFVEGLKNLLGAVDIEIGEATFDAAFAVRADEPARARALLAAPVHQLLLAAEAPIVVTDGGVLVDHALSDVGPPHETVDWLHLQIRAVVAIATAIDAARNVDGNVGSGNSRPV